MDALAPLGIEHVDMPLTPERVWRAIEAKALGGAMYTTHPAEFEYHRPATSRRRVALLGAGDGARPLAGGHSLLPLMKLRLAHARPRSSTSAGSPGSTRSRRDGDGVRIGAMATHEAVAVLGRGRAACPVLAETAARHRRPAGAEPRHDRRQRRPRRPGRGLPDGADGARRDDRRDGPGRRARDRGRRLLPGLFTTALARGRARHRGARARNAARTGAAYVKKKHPASGYAVVGAAAVVANGSVAARDRRGRGVGRCS